MFLTLTHAADYVISMLSYRCSIIQSYPITCQKIGKSVKGEIRPIISQMEKPNYRSIFYCFKMLVSE